METTTPNIDFSFLDAMLKISKGDPRFVTESVNRFLKNSERDSKEIFNYRENHDRELLKTKTHKLISSCSVVGAMRIIELCQKLSRKSDDEDEGTILSWLENLEVELVSAEKTLRDYLLKIKK